MAKKSRNGAQKTSPERFIGRLKLQTPICTSRAETLPFLFSLKCLLDSPPQTVSLSSPQPLLSTPAASSFLNNLNVIYGKRVTLSQTYGLFWVFPVGPLSTSLLCCRGRQRTWVEMGRGCQDTTFGVVRPWPKYLNTKTNQCLPNCGMSGEIMIILT